MDTSNNIYFYLENWKTIPDIYNKIEKSIKTYIDISSNNFNNILPLCYALQLRCEFKIIEIIYKHCNKLIHIVNEYQHYNNNDNCIITYRDSIKWQLCLMFHHIFIKKDIKDHIIYSNEYIQKEYEYLTKCLSILNLKESDIDWNLPLINGYYN